MQGERAGRTNDQQRRTTTMGSYAINQRIDVWTDRIVWFALSVGVLGMLLLVLVIVSDGLGERTRVGTSHAFGIEASDALPSVTAAAPEGAAPSVRALPPPRAGMTRVSREAAPRGAPSE
jgi:hypothetical protein